MSFSSRSDKCDCEENLERQWNEIVALSSIYEDRFTVLHHSGNGYQVKLEVDLPGPISIRQPHEGESRILKYLPPLKMHITLPDTYPSHACPDVNFHTPWLMHVQVLDIKQKLKSLWDENEFSEILFIWAEFLRNDVVDFLTTSSSIVLLGKEYNDVISYDKAKRRHEFEHSTVTCEICFEMKPGLECFVFNPCEHFFCNDCIRADYEIKIREGNLAALLCPSQPCESKVNLDQLKSLVRSETFEHYDQLLLQASLDKMSDVHFCPAKNCSYPVIVDRSDGIGMCPNCRHVFCIYCRKTSHGIELCKDKSEAIKQLVSEYEAASRVEKEALVKRYGKKHFQKVFDELSSNWVKDNGKPCPSCRSYIEKMGGCHKMHCYKCNNYFCWLCCEVLPTDKPYAHFSDESSSCYNKLFLGVEVDQDAPFEEYDGQDEQYDYYGVDDNAEPQGQVVDQDGQNDFQAFVYEQPEAASLDFRSAVEDLYGSPFILNEDDLEQVTGEGYYEQDWEEFGISVANMQQQLLDIAGYHPEKLEQEGSSQQRPEGEICFPQQGTESL